MVVTYGHQYLLLVVSAIQVAGVINNFDVTVDDQLTSQRLHADSTVCYTMLHGIGIFHKLVTCYVFG